MADDEDIAALVIDNGSGMCKGTSLSSRGKRHSVRRGRADDKRRAMEEGNFIVVPLDDFNRSFLWRH